MQVTDHSTVIAGDGRWPTSWPTSELAAIVAGMRHRLEALPRSRDTFRGEPCWLVPPQPGERYPRLNVSRQIAAAMGLAIGESRRKKAKAHRISFFVFNGHRPVAGTVDHACRRKYCVNPTHLDDVTEEQNLILADHDPWDSWVDRTSPDMPRAGGFSAVTEPGTTRPAP